MRKHSSKPENIRVNKSISKEKSGPNNIRTSTNHHSNNYKKIITKSNNTVQAKNLQARIEEQKTRRFNIRAGNAKSYILNSNTISMSMAIKPINHQPSRSLSKELNLASKLHNRYKHR
jgi:hypothetical protein